MGGITGMRRLTLSSAGVNLAVKRATTIGDEETKTLEVDDCGDLKLGLRSQYDGVATKGI
jgi:hypothetical protein